jgi:hypothetical protein
MNTHNLPISHAVTTLPSDDPRSPANIERRKVLKLAERDELGRLYPGSVLERAGRPEGHTVTFLARQHTAQAIGVLREIVDDAKAPPAARATAAQALLDRGWGKAPIQIDVTARANFSDFSRDMGVAARCEHDHPAEGEEQSSFPGRVRANAPL